MAEAAKINELNAPLLRTPLYDLHLELGAKMVPFAGYEMPVQYPLGVMGEHLHTRSQAGLFDVSHMGQARLVPLNDDTDAGQIFEQLVPAGLTTLKEGRIRYSQLTNQEGGILDDLMVTRFGQTLWLVVNAACKEADYAHIQAALAGQANLEIETRGLLALQGPKAATVLAKLFPQVADMPFMSACYVDWQVGSQKAELLISRCGYTGEDGFEISLPENLSVAFAQTLLADDAVAMIGLGARDSLRLEAGLCLYGHDIDTTTTPAQADLMWSIPKRRLEAADFPGAEVINQQITEKIGRKRVGIAPEGRAPAREGALIQALDGQEIGVVTSGGFSPSLKAPIAMGYVAAEQSAIGTQVQLIVRGKALPAKITALPFVPQNYYRGKS
ncbi:MAG: glycine cleavage system aminomethyltransferase GcvT [Parvibaculales bacterium]